ncbi:hypothetical protein OESDEN_10794 [Oesophagostomum dentatum]|uniref:Uncharacterized protein n=1 Tax=Oesophagostomum dentatum TaxID=61180 RepID=A0A0B1SVP4_OESDE|nr:hypothetical protein OESDEN_10794 [Oesophagostomum dentatum]
MRFILLIVAFLVATESRVVLDLLGAKKLKSAVDEDSTSNPNKAAGEFEGESDYDVEGDIIPDTATEGEEPPKSGDTSNNEQQPDSSDQEEATTALTVPCQDDTGFASVHLNSLDNVGIYEHYGIRLSNDEHFNAVFLRDTLEEIRSLPHSEVSSAVATAGTLGFFTGRLSRTDTLESVTKDALEKLNDTALEDTLEEIRTLPHSEVLSAVATAGTLGFFTGHLSRTDTLESVTKDALEKLNDTALEKLARFKVAFTLQSHAVLYLKTVMALDRIKDQYGERKPLAFQGTKYNRMGRVISRLEKAVHSLRQSLTKPETLYYGDVENLIDLLKDEPLLNNSLDILVHDKDWVEDTISEYLGGFEETDNNENEVDFAH